MLSEILKIYKNKRVLVTGHTGFKGSWLTQWLFQLEARICGYALPPPTHPALFEQLNLKEKITHYENDIRNFDTLKECVSKEKPDIIFHLAAQPLVRESYNIPLETMETNVMGTANLLEAVRGSGIKTNVIIITSDKCYENKEWLFGYRENDEMGGYDPYSASKGAAEIVASSWRRSFFHPGNHTKHGVKVATVRAGNVIGGGDWSKDRIVPDCIRFLQQNQDIKVRNPLATRPWQHVLEPLGGYLLLGAKLLENNIDYVEKYCTSFNFGPLISSNKTVELLVEEIIKNWGEGNWTYNKEDAHHEASLLNLTVDKVYHLLQWHPVWDFETTIKNTVNWYRALFQKPETIIALTKEQIIHYMSTFKLMNVNK